MEDEYIILNNKRIHEMYDFDKNINIHICSIYDGHGGISTARYLKENLHKYVLKILVKRLNESESIPPSLVKESILNGFAECSSEILDIQKRDELNDGSCCIFVLIIYSTVFVVNLGNSKAVLSRERKPKCLTQDHTATTLSERIRLRKLGIKAVNGRVQGILEVSRSFGDINMRKYGIISIPDVRVHFSVKPIDDYLLIGCDGLWARYNPDMAVKFINDKLFAEKGHVLPEDRCDTITSVCNALVEDAVFKKGCQDNVSAMIIRFCQ